MDDVVAKLAVAYISIQIMVTSIQQFFKVKVVLNNMRFDK